MTSVAVGNTLADKSRGVLLEADGATYEIRADEFERESDVQAKADALNLRLDDVGAPPYFKASVTDGALVLRQDWRDLRGAD